MTPWYSEALRWIIACSTTLAAVVAWWAYRRAPKQFRTVLLVAGFTFTVLAVIRIGIATLSLHGWLPAVFRRGDVTNVLRIVLDATFTVFVVASLRDVRAATIAFVKDMLGNGVD